MLVISYVYDKCDVFKTKVFFTEEEAKAWFIDEIVELDLHYYWFDDDTNTEYHLEHLEDEIMIKECLFRTNLERIVEKIMDLHRIQVNVVNF